MNNNIMKRPMFRLGGKAASQGTGITSGLDERVNLQNAGFLGTGMSQADFTNLTPQQLLTLQASMASQPGQMDDMRDIVKLQALSSLVGNVLPNIERGGVKGVADFFRDPQTTQTALAGLTGLKQIDIAGKKLDRQNLANLVKNQIALKESEATKAFRDKQFGLSEQTFNLQKDKFDFTKEQAIEAGERADRKLDIAEKKALIKSATQLKFEASQKARAILEEQGVTSGLEITDPILQSEYFSLSGLAGDTITQANARKLAINAVNRQQSERNAQRIAEGLNAKDFTPEEFSSKVDFLTKQFLGTILTTGGNAMGGMPNRVNRQMGTPREGEQPLPEDSTKPVNPFQPKPIKPLPDKGMAMQDTGNDVYAMLRARLPAEITDDVVKLISYNKEAFADFASIKNQEDVKSFNEKYNMELVIDVATV
tara:strand:- start:56 stop:1330 length:1275 start_codon:yes stop_codon:yes gene_type:complete